MKVLVAIDDTPYSKQLAEVVSERPWPDDTQFKVVTVIEPINVTLPEELGPDIEEDIEARRKQHAESVAEDTRKKIMEHVPHSLVHYEVRHGQPASEIVAAAADWRADLIMIGAKGRQVCPHHLLGSISRSVAGQAPCGVEVVRNGQSCASKKREKEKSKTCSCA